MKRGAEVTPDETAERLVYLLRCWQEETNGQGRQWRFSLEGTQQEERHAFGSLDDLVGFLRRHLADVSRQRQNPTVARRSYSNGKWVSGKPRRAPISHRENPDSRPERHGNGDGIPGIPHYVSQTMTKYEEVKL